MKRTSLLYILIAVLTFCAFSAQQTVSAQTNCLPVNNGGTTNRQVCLTPAPQSPTATPQSAPSQTKGGLPIYPSSNSQSTPSTGPDDWALPSLLFLGAVGLLLRKKAKVT